MEFNESFTVFYYILPLCTSIDFDPYPYGGQNVHFIKWENQIIKFLSTALSLYVTTKKLQLYNGMALFLLSSIDTFFCWITWSVDLYTVLKQGFKPQEEGWY